jgi:hypothetical protein
VVIQEVDEVVEEVVEAEVVVEGVVPVEVLINLDVILINQTL